MTIVCVDDHSVMLKGLKQSVEQILPDASTVAFSNADEALAFVNENGCDILIAYLKDAMYTGYDIEFLTLFARK